MPELWPSREGRLHRVVAHRLERVDADVALAGLQHLLPRTVALHLGRGRVDAHQLERDAECGAVVERHFEQARLLVHGQCGRAGSGGHDARVYRAASGSAEKTRPPVSDFTPGVARARTHRIPRPRMPRSAKNGLRARALHFFHGTPGHPGRLHLDPLLALALCSALLWVGAAVAWEACAPGALRTGSLDLVAVVLVAAGLWWPAHAGLRGAGQRQRNVALALVVLLGGVTAFVARLGVMAPWLHPQQLLGSGGVLLASLAFLTLLHALPGDGPGLVAAALMAAALLLAVALRALHRPLRHGMPRTPRFAALAPSPLGGRAHRRHLARGGAAAGFRRHAGADGRAHRARRLPGGEPASGAPPAPGRAPGRCAEGGPGRADRPAQRGVPSKRA